MVPDDPADAFAALGRLEVIEGDIGAPLLGLDDTTYRRVCGGIDEVWHSAASLSFIEEHRAEIFRMNVGGTERVVEMTGRTPGKRLHHVSTAYVAGRRFERVLESELDVGQEFRNPYEESKCRAEAMVEREHRRGGILATIYRPSVVIGDSGSGRATHLHGVYAFIRGLWSVVERTRRETGQEAVELPLRVRGDINRTLNFVPIDYVTRAMLHAGSSESSVGRRFHMTNPGATPNRLWLGTVCEQLGVRGVELVSDDAFETKPMTRIETIFHRQMAFYYQYLAGEPEFDCGETLAAIEGSGIHCPEVTPEFTRKMTGWYIDQLNRTAAEA
jgi:nucleoside-diphosphate-sugar epimerase